MAMGNDTSVFHRTCGTETPTESDDEKKKLGCLDAALP